MSYLQTKRAERDFYEIMLRNRYNSRETLNEWQSFLVKQGINENDVIPYRIVSSIETAISTNDVLKQFNFRYGMEPGKLVIDISTNSAGGSKNTGEINLDFGSPVDKSPDNYIKTTFYKPKLEEGEIVTPF